jgi:leucyl aminopeptidase
MPVTLTTRKGRASRPVHFIAKDGLGKAGLDPRVIKWAEANGFSGQEGRVLVVPGEDGAAAAALFGAPASREGFSPLAAGRGP